MKSKLILLTVLLVLFISCSSKKSDTATQENTVTTQTEITENKETFKKKNIAEVEDFSDFQDKILKEYSKFDIINFEVSKYAKGMELLFTTTNKEFPKDKFIEISKHCLKELKNTYIIDESLSIPTYISYQKNSQSDAIFLYDCTSFSDY